MSLGHKSKAKMQFSFLLLMTRLLSALADLCWFKPPCELGGSERVVCALGLAGVCCLCLIALFFSTSSKSLNDLATLENGEISPCEEFRLPAGLEHSGAGAALPTSQHGNGWVEPKSCFFLSMGRVLACHHPPRPWLPRVLTTLTLA